MTIHYYQLETTPPVPVATVQPGDWFRINHTTGTVDHMRGAAVHAILSSNYPGTNLGEFPPEPPHDGYRRVTYAKEKPMPGQNVSMTGVMENPTTGAVTLKYSSGNQSEYASWADVGAVADTLDASPEFAEKLLAAKAYRSSPDGSNKSNQVGASVSVNATADTPAVYTPPV